MFDLRLASAEFLKLRRRRGMLALAGLLTLGLVLFVQAVMVIRHAGDPLHHGPAGGLDNYVGGVGVMSTMAMVVGAIVGGTAGTQDIESGVFRDLVTTGRSRLALFGARVIGAWAIVLPLLGLTMAVMAGLDIALAGSLATPHAGAIAAGTLSILAAGAAATAAAVGLSALVGSRGPVIGAMLAFLLALQPLIVQISFLGQLRAVMPSLDISRIGHVELPHGISIGLAGAIAALVAWSAASLGLGAWKTASREI